MGMKGLFEVVPFLKNQVHRQKIKWNLFKTYHQLLQGWKFVFFKSQFALFLISVKKS